MGRLAQYFAWTLASAVYWGTALLLVGFLSLAIPGDCGLEDAEAMLRACKREAQLVAIGGLAFAIAIYVAAVRAVRATK